MRTVWIVVLSLLVCSGVRGANPELRFRPSGEFKIVQFTDVHFQSGNPASEIALTRIGEVLACERPDLVVFTGDIVYNAPADRGLKRVLECVAACRIPFVALFGNHDAEQGMSRDRLYDVMRSVACNIQPDRGGEESPDYALTIRSSGGQSDACILYCMDSNDYSHLRDVKGYGWFRFSQIRWYLETSRSFKDRNGGRTLPALAFFHIPLPEYNQASADEQTVMIGTRMERACSGALNTGMFAAMKEAGDVMGVFVGHDHDNDYSVLWHHILLAYGRYTGGNTEYNHLPNGARVILLKEGERRFETWICEAGGRRVDFSVYPDSYVKDDWRRRKPVQ
ncbi:metallophosphoesterase family protein [Alistipes sp.]|uniref:metallophosphoesterase family protein n=1 Tax=Alistipes sp. TaxID=1872444 RepID=UPI0025C39362|nr:metallophosphoesterase family protein [Alistipes sp.]